jgi:hypothetical protein
MLDRIFESVYQSSQKLVEGEGFKRPSAGAETATSLKKDLNRGLTFLRRLKFRDPEQTSYLESLLSSLEGIFDEANEVLDAYLENNPLPPPKPSKTGLWDIAPDDGRSFSGGPAGGYNSFC